MNSWEVRLILDRLLDSKQRNRTRPSYRRLCPDWRSKAIASCSGLSFPSFYDSVVYPLLIGSLFVLPRCRWLSKSHKQHPQRDFSNVADLGGAGLVTSQSSQERYADSLAWVDCVRWKGPKFKENSPSGKSRKDFGRLMPRLLFTLIASSGLIRLECLFGRFSKVG